MKNNFSRNLLLLLIASITILGYSAEPLKADKKTISVCFGPYLKGPGPDSGANATVPQVKKYLGILKKAGITEIRFYTCAPLKNSTESMASLAKKMGFKVATGGWVDNDLIVNKREIGYLEKEIKNGNVDLIICASEAMQRGKIKPEKLIEYIEQIKKVAGDIPVTIDDTPEKIKENPDVVNAVGKYIMINPYPIWARTNIDQAFEKFVQMYNEVKAKYPDKIIIIGETGWSSDGNKLGEAKPSLENMLKYLKLINDWRIKNNVIVYWFEAFDEDWKVKGEGPLGAHWGLWDNNGILKPGVAEILFKKTIKK